MRPWTPWIAATLLIAPRIAAAEGSDPGAARVQLQQGYTLKQQGKCVEAIAYFQESIRLDRHPKAILNLADCEAKVGKLVSAQSHLVEARDLARSRGQNDYEALAIKQMASVEARMPKLVVQLAKDAPPDAVVIRDGVELGKLSLGTQLPLDPGTHEIVVRVGGSERRYSLTLGEAEQKTMEVTGPARTPAPVTPVGPKKQADLGNQERSPAAHEDPGGESHGLGGQRVAALVVGGVGVIGMGISLAVVQSAKSSWQEAAGRCQANVCDDPTAVDDANAARRQGNVATIVFAAGAAAAVTGGILWLTAPSTRSSAFNIAPMLGSTVGGVLLRGTY